MQTTLYGQVLVTDADNYKRIVNAFVRYERRGRGRASQKCAADQTWQVASNPEKRKLFEDEKPWSLTPSTAAEVDYGF